MNRRDWMYRQKVTEGELDGAFDGCEDSDRALTLDSGLARDDNDPGKYGGIMWGFEASHPSGLNMAFAMGSGYDGGGKRIHTSSTYAVTCTHIGDVTIGQGGVPAGASASPAVGYECWLSVFIVFDRLQSDRRYDGYNEPVYFIEDESFHFYVSKGADKLIGTLLPADKPIRESNKLLLTDMRVENVSGTPAYVEHDTLRKEWSFSLEALHLPNKTLTAGRTREAISDLLQLYNDHVGGIDDKHPSEDVTFASSSLWYDGVGGLFGEAHDVDGALNGIVSDLAKATEAAGAKHVGAKAVAGAYPSPYPGDTNLTALTQGSIQSQLGELLLGVNGRIRRGGDKHIGGSLVPNTDGLALGEKTPLNKRWDVNSRDLSAASVTSDLIPLGDGTQNLGSTGHAWNAAINSIGMNSVSSDIIPTVDGQDLGSLSPSLRRWDANIKDLTVNQVKSSLVPEMSGSALGSPTNRWGAKLTSLDAQSVSSDLIPTVDGTQALGSGGVGGRSWNAYLMATLTNTLGVGEVTSDLIPTASGQLLGDSGHAWSASLDDVSIDSSLTVTGLVKTDLVPENVPPGDPPHSLGTGSNRWNAQIDDIVLNNLWVEEKVQTSLLPIASGLDLGSSSLKWDAYLHTVSMDYAVIDSAYISELGAALIKTDLIPSLATLDLGSAIAPWNWAYFDNSFSDNLVATVAGFGLISQGLIPANTEAQDIGAPSLKWNNAYIANADITDSHIDNLGVDLATIGLVMSDLIPFGTLDLGASNLRWNNAHISNLNTYGQTAQSIDYGFEFGKHLETTLASRGLNQPLLSTITRQVRTQHGFVEDGCSHECNCILPVAGTIAAGDIKNYIAPWTGYALTGTPVFSHARGWNNRSGIGFFPEFNLEKLMLTYGASGQAPFLALDKPGIRFAFFVPESTEDISRDYIYINLNAEDNTKKLYIKFDGDSYITMNYWDGSNLQEYTGAASASNGILYCGQIVILDATHFLFTLFQNGNIEIFNQIVTASYISIPGSLGIVPSVTVENRNLGTGAAVVFHRLGVSGAVATYTI